MFSYSAIYHYYRRVSHTSLFRLYVLIMILVIFLAMTSDAFQQRLAVPATTVAFNRRIVASSASSAFPLPNKNEYYYKQQVALFAATSGDEESPTYDFIKVEEAEEMIQKERTEHDEEIRKMEDMLEYQREQLREFDHYQDNPDFFVMGDDRSGYSSDENNNSVDVIDGSTSFPSSSSSSSTSSSTAVNSHIATEFRTLEIALQQINDQNKELKEQINDQYYSYQSYREEMQQRLSDARDRFDCIQHELSKERSKVKLLEMEILEKTKRDTRERKQQQEDEVEYQKQQELMQKQVHQQDHQRDHRLLELERLEEQFNDLYQSMDIGNGVDNSKSNIHAIRIPELMDEGRGQQQQQQQQQHQYPSDTTYPRNNPAHQHFKEFWS
jgi:hypothetical protein